MTKVLINLHNLCEVQMEKYQEALEYRCVLHAKRHIFTCHMCMVAVTMMSAYCFLRDGPSR